MTLCKKKLYNSKRDAKDSQLSCSCRVSKENECFVSCHLIATAACFIQEEFQVARIYRMIFSSFPLIYSHKFRSQKYIRSSTSGSEGRYIY